MTACPWWSIDLNAIIQGDAGGHPFVQLTPVAPGQHVDQYKDIIYGIVQRLSNNVRPAMATNLANHSVPQLSNLFNELCRNDGIIP